jgi:transcriptional regulator with XRE-family HTH domain
MSREALFAALSQDDSNADAELAKVAVAADLAVLIHRAGLKRSDIAERLGWTRARVSQVLSGEGNLTIETIHAVAKAAGFAFDVLFREKGARRAVQMWERPLKLELEVNEAMSFSAPRSGQRTRGALEVVLSSEQSFFVTNDARMELVELPSAA